MRGRPRKSDNDFDYTVRMAWYRSRGWKKNAEAALALAGKCERCGASGCRLEAHHIADPFPTRNKELLLRLDNIEVTCAKCHRKEHHSKGAPTTCEICKTTVRHNPCQKRRRFCSIACRDMHPNFARMAERSCPVCLARYTPTRGAQKTCGRTCGSALAGLSKRKS